MVLYFLRIIKGYLTWSGWRMLAVVQRTTIFPLPMNLYWAGIFVY
jgi:hypothetical protein